MNSPATPAVIRLLDRVDAKRDLNPGCHRGAVVPPSGYPVRRPVLVLFAPLYAIYTPVRQPGRGGSQEIVA